ncbi:hypothetical protein CPA45_13335 [Vreelandella nigrificans]|uniref:Uncharacterized protein n=1 Tax=Vreelandella nigrificans TaxID=2042704 RepID=A0A2A4HLG3_9GAMM|nr:hypothetical protein CPA45_13335 [Halomonas nigrificans]
MGVTPWILESPLEVRFSLGATVRGISQPASKGTGQAEACPRTAAITDGHKNSAVNMGALMRLG